MVVIATSNLRENLDAIFDDIIKNAAPIGIEYRGQTLIISPQQTSRLARIVPKKIAIDDDNALINNEWSSKWKPFI